MNQPKSIYIIGAQCTGKTTLVEDVARQLQQEQPTPLFTVIKELARNILKIAGVDRNDIKAGSVKAGEFQRLVLQAQLDAEIDGQTRGFIISDRSGIDPVAYTKLYGPSAIAEELLESPQWKFLRERMCQGLVVLCEPVPAWLFDDGTRLMPEDNQEWFQLHRVFIKLLQEAGIAFEVLPTTCVWKEERVAFVVERWKNK